MQTERKRAMQTVLRAIEQERVRLAADLHDGPVQELTALRYGLSRARNRIQRGQPEQGLEVALHNQVRSFEATSGVACAISTGLQGRLASDLETVPYRVTQETLNNVGKHAGASRVTVSLAAENGSVRLRINDDGVGFDPITASRLLGEGHFGLAGMRERVEMVGGHLSIDSAPGPRHHRRRRDGRPPGRAGRRLAPPASVGASGPPRRNNGFADAVGAAVFGEEGEGAGGEDGLGGLFGLVGGEDHDLDVGVVLGDRRGGLEAVRGGHPQVHQDHVGAERAGEGDAFDAVGGLAHDLDAGVLEHAPQGVADGGGVVDQQDPGGGLGIGPRLLYLAVLWLGHRRLVPR